MSENSPDSNDKAVGSGDGSGDGLGDLALLEFDAIDIPDQTEFKIGEVAKLLDLEPYVLRYWEKEFEILSPAKTDSGQRTYRRDDIELAATIRHLLYTEMFTIDGARRQLELARDGEPSYLTTTLTDAGEPDTNQQARQLRQEKEALEDELATARHQIEELKEARRGLREEVEQLEDRLDERTGGSDEELQKWRRTAKTYKDRVDELKAELAEARERIERLEEQEAASDEGLGPEAVETQRELLADMKREVSALSRLAAG